jgi:hypothetical protein
MNELFVKLADYLFSESWIKCKESYENMCQQFGVDV